MPMREWLAIACLSLWLPAADGASATFRQTFRDLGDGRFETTLMRKTADGWTPTFPGSERLVMARRAT